MVPSRRCARVASPIPSLASIPKKSDLVLLPRLSPNFPRPRRF